MAIKNTRFIIWLRRGILSWGLHGRIVAGYAGLFAVLLTAIALGEATVVDNILVADRTASLPAVAHAVANGLTHSGWMRSSQQGKHTSPGILGNDNLVAGLIDNTGSVIYAQFGTAVGTLNPAALLTSQYTRPGSLTHEITYQRSLSNTTFLVRLIPLTAMRLAPNATPQNEASSTSPPGAPDLIATPMTLVVAESMQPVETTVKDLLIVSLAASALGLLLAAALGVAVTRRALRPLDRMTATARAIADGGDGALDRRLHLPNWGDEVSQLASTFDRMLDRIQATIAERVRSETRLRRFAADASHELRTPLAAVRGYTEVLLMGGKDNPQTADRALRQMDRELARMTRLVGDLLTLARLEAGLPVHLVPIDVAPVLSELADETRQLANRAQRDLAITITTPTQEPNAITVLADPDRLRQILLNLLHNAVRFTPNGGAVTIQATRQGEMVSLSVQDTGPGIAEDELPSLFERFYRGDKARARHEAVEGGGAGLGLAIAQGLAQAQAGYISVDSILGHGATFTLYLPAAPIPPNPAPTPQTMYQTV